MWQILRETGRMKNMGTYSHWERRAAGSSAVRWGLCGGKPMTLEELVGRVEKQVLDLGKRLLPGGARQAWREELERLRSDLNEHHAHARHFREAVQQLRQRLADNV